MDLVVRRLLHDLLTSTAAQHPDKVAVVAQGKAHTYSELVQSVSALAATMQRLGVKRGDRVALYMENSMACAISIFAASLAASVFVVINPQTRPDRVRFILEDCGAVLVLTEAHLLRHLEAALEGAPDVKAVICDGSVDPTLARELPLVPFTEALAATNTPQPSNCIPRDVASLVYTSGTTGQPKGVMMTHRGMLFVTESVVEYLRLGSDDRILNVLPFAFGYGLYQLLQAAMLGATLVLERSFAYPAQVFTRIEQQGATVFPGVPTMYASILAAHARKPLCFPTVTRLTNAAAALPEHYVPKLREVFPNALLFQMYGQTECKRVCYLEPELALSKPGSVGKAIPGTEVLVLRADGTVADPDEVGVLHVRGDHVMAGYWNQPELTDVALKAGPVPGERMLCTGDHFRADAEGFLYFVARGDDIVKVRGEKVSPVEVENVLHGLPGVQEAAVVGVPDELWGSALRAFVALRPGHTSSASEIRQLCGAQLEGYKVPKEVVFLTELPKTHSGKVSRKELKDWRPDAGESQRSEPT